MPTTPMRQTHPLGRSHTTSLEACLHSTHSYSNPTHGNLLLSLDRQTPSWGQNPLLQGVRLLGQADILLAVPCPVAMPQEGHRAFRAADLQKAMLL